MSSTNFSSFDSKAKSFLICSSDNRVKLFDVDKKFEVRNYIEKRHLSHSYLCCSRSKLNDDLGYFAVGTDDSCIIIWDLPRGIVLREISLPADSIPHDIQFSLDAKYVYVSLSSNRVLVYDIHSGELIKTIKSGKKSALRIAINPKLEVLALANSSVKLIDISSGKKRRLQAYFVGGISNISFTQCGRYLICSGVSNKEIIVFDIHVDFDKDSPIATISTSHTPIHIITRSVKKSIQIFAFYEDNGGAVIKISGKIGSDDQIIEISEVHSRHTILNGVFTEMNSSVILATGTIHRPIFNRLSFLDSDENLLQDLTLEAIVSSTESQNNTNSNKIDTSLKLQTHSASILGPENLGSLKRPVIDENSELAKKSKISLDSIATTLTLEERLHSLNSSMQKLEDFNIEHLNSVTAPTTDSLVTVIDQALQSGDDSLLEQCLACEDNNVIEGTAKALPSNKVIVFLRKLVAKFEKRPSRGILLTKWLSNILRYHTSFLVSIPDLSSQLAGLSQMLEQRLSSYSRLTSLNGRLELLMSQLLAKSSFGSSQNDPYVPLHTYVEE